jgi:hypothetical protein
MRYWSIAARAAEQQHLVLAPWQLTALGLCHETIRRHGARHGWRVDDLGMWWLPGPDAPLRRIAAAYLAFSKPSEAWTRLSVKDWDDEAAVALALVQAARDSDVVVCGPTAAWLHGLRDTLPDDIWLLVGVHAGRRKRAGVRLRYGSLPVGGTTILQDLPVLDIEHTIIDNARVPMPSRTHLHYELVRLLRHAERQRLTTRAKVRKLADRPGKFRGKPVLLAVLDDLDGQFSHSGAEDNARVLAAAVVAEFGLTLHPEPYDIHLDGIRIAEADIAVLEIRYDIEVDGPHHLLPEQQRKDRNRDRLVMEAQWFPERFPTELIDLSPRTFQTQVRQTIRRLMRQHGLDR